MGFRHFCFFSKQESVTRSQTGRDTKLRPPRSISGKVPLFIITGTPENVNRKNVDYAEKHVVR